MEFWLKQLIKIKTTYEKRDRQNIWSGSLASGQ